MSNTPQPGIFDEGAKHMYFLEYRLQSEETSLIKKTLMGAVAQAQSAVVCFGKQAWNKLQPNWTPQGLDDFKLINGLEGHVAPSTQADIFFWVQGADISGVFDQAMSIHQAMQKIAELTLEQRGFDYHQSMDLIGFEDGTANPKTDELKRDAAFIPQGQPGAGGSLVLSQKWVHDLAKWGTLPVHCQEAVVGRTKVENEELEGDAMPIDSHVSRTDLKVDGEAMKIYRRSAPFGTVQENGLLFLAFAKELKRFSTQLDSMYGLNEEGVIDQILNYSKAVSGSYWFAPTQEDLQQALS